MRCCCVCEKRKKKRENTEEDHVSNENRWKNILVGCLTVFGILIPSLSCRAENVGSIQIEYHGRTQENEEVVFANADFSVFVGKMEDGQWTLAGDFGNAGVSLEGIESSEKRTGKAVIQLCGSAKYTGNALKTDENGIAMIGGLEQGLYLIAQTKVHR